MRRLLFCLIMISLMLPLVAQIDLPRPNLNPFRTSSNTLIHMDKIQMSHSMGFQAGTSSTGDGYYLSRYTNHIMYKFNPKLELNLDLNFVNYGTANSSNKFTLNKDNANTIIPEFSLRYRPTDSILIQVEMNQGGYMAQNRKAWYETW
ncbi:MAG: hypothetical protein PHY48_14565 [Candidatus Cloacimonetes bacterium]|nr:hypothetical protein [Candidatus Cloacimonadota bacterium]